MIAAYIDQVIMLLVGGYMTAVAFGAVSPPGRDPARAQAWLAKTGRYLRIGGPLLIVIALILAAAQFFGFAA